MKQDFKNLYKPNLREQKEEITTKDGTKTLYSKEFDECYHSVADGALIESLNKHVIPASNLTIDKNSLTILDICYGLGFNTLATLYYYKNFRPNVKLHIISPEIDRALVESLKEFNYPKEFREFEHIINAVSTNFYYEDINLKVEVLIGDARDTIKDIKTKCDIIYQDAFSPQKNPALWSVEWFREIKNISNIDTILTTYSISAPVRFSLYEAGFQIYEFVSDKSIKSKRGTIASFKELPHKWIDIELKKTRSPSRAIRDGDI